MNQSLIDNGLETLGREFEGLGVELSGYYDQPGRTLVIRCSAPQSREILERHIELYHKVFFHIPIDGRGRKFRFELDTYESEEEFSHHRIVLQTSIELMPDSGGVTRAEWEAYADQLEYTIDGILQTPVPPDGFIEGEE